MFYSCILFLIDRSLIFVCVIYCFYICVPVLYDVILISCICPFIFIVITVVCLSLKLYYCIFFFFKQKTAYDVRIIDWSSDVCSSDLGRQRRRPVGRAHGGRRRRAVRGCRRRADRGERGPRDAGDDVAGVAAQPGGGAVRAMDRPEGASGRLTHRLVQLGLQEARDRAHAGEREAGGGLGLGVVVGVGVHVVDQRAAVAGRELDAGDLDARELQEALEPRLQLRVDRLDDLEGGACSAGQRADVGGAELEAAGGIHLDRVEEVAADELRPGDDGLRRRDMLLQQVDAVARLLERRRRDIGRQRVGIDEGLHAQPLAASVRGGK